MGGKNREITLDIFGSLYLFKSLSKVLVELMSLLIKSPNNMTVFKIQPDYCAHHHFVHSLIKHNNFKLELTHSRVN